MSTENGQILDCQVQLEGPSPLALTDAERKQVVTFTVRAIPDQPLPTADKDHPGSLKITSLTMVGEKLYAGTQSRGLLLIEGGEAKEVAGKPRSYFINALETDSQGRLWVGVTTRAEDSGLLDESEPLKPTKTNGATGPVMAITRGPRDDGWIGTDGRGAFHFQGGKPIEHFTFEGDRKSVV